MPNRCLKIGCDKELLDREGNFLNDLKPTMKNGSLGIECPNCHTFNTVRSRPVGGPFGPTVFDIDGIGRPRD